MNIVTANENKQVIDRLQFEIIKRIDGQYELKDLLGQLVNMYFNKLVIDITSIKNYQNPEVMQALAKSVDPNRVILLLNNNPAVTSPSYMSLLVRFGFYNFCYNYEGIVYLYNSPNSFKDVQHLLLNDNQMGMVNSYNNDNRNTNYNTSTESGGFRKTNNRLIIGLVNLTQHAGASSLTHMMVRQLRNRGVIAYGIEMFRNDLLFYHRPDDLFSCMNRNDLEREFSKHNDAQAYIIDLNEFGEADKYCDMVLYLLEPSFIKLTKLIKKDRNAFAAHKNDKVVLNISFVNQNEVSDFENETGLRIYYNIPPLNDRNQDIEEINNFLRKLGFRI